MPLADENAREAIHHRSVDCRGYRRADGLWDIEGELVDTKGYPFTNAFRGTIEPGTPLHQMHLRLTVDDDLVVVDVAATIDEGPYAVCPAITTAFDSLKGLRIGPGWRRAVHQRVGGVKGCTHLVELLGPMATAAVQTILPLRNMRPRATDDGSPPPHLDTCHALRRDGSVVRRHHPEWYTGPEPDDGEQRGTDQS